MSLIALVPARRGSQGIKGKNTAILDGKPLVAHVLTTLSSMSNVDRVIVSTDDPNVAAIAVLYGVEVVGRPEVLANGAATIDEVVEWFRVENGVENGYLVVQPTVPEVTVSQLNELMTKGGEVAWALSVPVSHLYYMNGQPLWDTRVNRQEMGNKITQEVGVRWYPPDSEGIVGVHPTTGLIDVDTLGDLVELRNKRGDWTVVFRVRVGVDVGMGHLTRCLAIAEQLQHHRVVFDVVEQGRPTFGSPDYNIPYPTNVVPQKGGRNTIVVNDTLDTSVEEMLELKAFGPVVTLEDHGGGSGHADVVINALYEGGDFSGPKFAVLRPEFIGVPATVPRRNSFAVSFGGVDPSHLTERVWGLMEKGDWVVGGEGGVAFIAPPGRPFTLGKLTTSMAFELASVRFVVTSCGRTLYEAAAVGTPAIAIAQNTRETTHAHLGLEYGNIFLGHHALVDDGEIVRAVDKLMNDDMLWDQLSLAAREQVDGKGVFRVARKVEDVMLEWSV